MDETHYHHGDLKNALIEAGVAILSKDGVAGLSLRKVARQAGVSHSAPYSHFTDKQALIAAISSEGFKQLYDQISTVFSIHKDDPANLLAEVAWAYVQFALKDHDRFKLMFSSVLEKERAYPVFVEESQQNFRQLVAVIQVCQRTGILKPGPSDLTAVTVWAAVHGLIMLVLEGQISHTVLDQYQLREMLLYSLNQISQVPLQ